MAVMCVRCKMLCALFLLIFAVIPLHSTKAIVLETRSTNEKPLNYFYYSTKGGTVHNLSKRSIEPQSVTSNSTTSTIIASATSPTPLNKVNETKHADALNKEVLNSSQVTPVPISAGINTPLQKNITKDEEELTEQSLQQTTPFATPLKNITESIPVVSKDNKTFDGDDMDDLTYPNVFDESYNKTMAENNITKTIEDYHQYYNSSLTMDPAVARMYWVNMNHESAKINDLLSHSHRRAATIRLSFDFPFYGQLVRNITIATGGFLYTGEYVHSWLAATQYIAPLMANFDTSLSNDSFIKYYDNGTAFTVHWENVALQDKPESGNFTFQTTLFKNGNIVFVYKDIPIAVEDIQDDHHPVKVGLSDAYISDRTVFYVRRKTIYEYHRVVFRHEEIKNWTSIYLTALPTCLSNKNCTACVTKPINGFKCMWCPGLNRCSSGMDRNRQGWVIRNCDRKKIVEAEKCATVIDNGLDLSKNHPSNGALPDYSHADRTTVDQPQQQPRVTHVIAEPKNVNMGVSSIITIIFLICLVAGIGIWVLYAYRNPHSISGQFLIRYRPSQWSWKRGEARYTAATIHM